MRIIKPPSARIMSTPKPLSILFVIAFCVSIGQAQVKSKPDFSGVWKLDHNKSTMGEIGERDAPIKIVYNDPELRITRTFERNGQAVEREFIYYTDGRGETNMDTVLLSSQPGSLKPEDIDKETVKSRTTWQRDKVVTHSGMHSMMGAYILEYDIVDEWKISRDGKTLTQTSRMVVYPGPMSRSTLVSLNPLDQKLDQKRVFSLVSK